MMLSSMVLHTANLPGHRVSICRVCLNMAEAVMTAAELEELSRVCFWFLQHIAPRELCERKWLSMKLLRYMHVAGSARSASLLRYGRDSCQGCSVRKYEVRVSNLCLANQHCSPYIRSYGDAQLILSPCPFGLRLNLEYENCYGHDQQRTAIYAVRHGDSISLLSI